MISTGLFSKKSAESSEYLAWKKEANEENFQKLFNSLKPTIDSAIMSFGGGDPSLTTRAKILASEAIKSYDPGKGAGIKTHVYNNLKRLSRISAERRYAVHIPESVRSDGIKVRDFLSQFEGENGHDPSDLEVADQLGMSIGRVQKARMKTPVPMTQVLTEKGDLPGQKRDRFSIWIDYVYHDLDERSRKIFEWSTGYGGSDMLPKKEIAKRLGITPAAVSQRITTIQGKLSEVRQ